MDVVTYLADFDLSMDELAALAELYGADLPACVMHQPAPAAAGDDPNARARREAAAAGLAARRVLSATADGVVVHAPYADIFAALFTPERSVADGHGATVLARGETCVRLTQPSAGLVRVTPVA